MERVSPRKFQLKKTFSTDSTFAITRRPTASEAPLLGGLVDRGVGLLKFLVAPRCRSLQTHFGHTPFGFQSLAMVIHGCDVS